jgi:hypothetical protein
MTQSSTHHPYLEEQALQASRHAALSEHVVKYARALRERLDAIRNAPLASGDHLPDPTPKRDDRIKAFALREDR